MARKCIPSRVPRIDIAVGMGVIVGEWMQGHVDVGRWLEWKLGFLTDWCIVWNGDGLVQFARRLRVRPVGVDGPRGPGRVHRSEVAAICGADQRAVRDAGSRGMHRTGDFGQIGADPCGDGHPVVQDRRDPTVRHVQLLGGLVHAVRAGDGADGFRGAPARTGLLQARLDGEAVLSGAGEVFGRKRRPVVSGRADLQLLGVREE